MGFRVSALSFGSSQAQPNYEKLQGVRAQLSRAGVPVTPAIDQPPDARGLINPQRPLLGDEEN